MTTQVKKETKAEWRERYRRHLFSSEWHDIKRKVMERAQNICEGCGDYKATEIHHLSYEHMGNEFLWEVVAVCADCHARYHGR
jgi:hypothetical protein